jgi:hypothetical protein
MAKRTGEEHADMTTLIEHAVTNAPAGDAPALPPEHYGCPPWCTVNSRNQVNHDRADGIPEWPNFDGYRHWAGLYIPYERNPYGEPLTVNVGLDPHQDVPVIAVCNAADDWAELTLDEAAGLAKAIARMVADARGHCPPWCVQGHANANDDGRHNASADVPYASAAPVDGETRPYMLDVTQDAPVIELSDGRHFDTGQVVKLSLAEADQVAGAITELIAAARERRPVSPAALAIWS